MPMDFLPSQHYNFPCCCWFAFFLTIFFYFLLYSISFKYEIQADTYSRTPFRDNQKYTLRRSKRSWTQKNIVYIKQIILVAFITSTITSNSLHRKIGTAFGLVCAVFLFIIIIIIILDLECCAARIGKKFNNRAMKKEQKQNEWKKKQTENYIKYSILNRWSERSVERIGFGGSCIHTHTFYNNTWKSIVFSLEFFFGSKKYKIKHKIQIV